MPSLATLRRLLLLGLAIVAACTDPATAPGAAPGAVPGAAPRFDADADDDDDDCDDDDDPCFLREDADAPALAQKVVRFWAVRGQERVGRIYYRPRPGASDSTELVRLTVPASAVLRRPTGRLVAVGDSIRITMTVTDTLRGQVTFLPAGLSFGASTPAALQFSDAETDDDLNRDGLVDATDAALRATVRVWRQESALAPWTALASTRAGSIVATTIPGFTNYILAY
jgi:hypothetical protein